MRRGISAFKYSRSLTSEGKASLTSSFHLRSFPSADGNHVKDQYRNFSQNGKPFRANPKFGKRSPHINDKGPNISAVPIPEAGDAAPIDNSYKVESLNEAIQRHRMGNYPTKVLYALDTARKGNFELATHAYMSGLWACVELANRPAPWKSLIYSVKFVYSKLIAISNNSTPPADVFEKCIFVACACEDVNTALYFIDEFRATKGDELKQVQYLRMLTKVLTLLSNRLNESSTILMKFTPDELRSYEDMQRSLHELYTSYRELRDSLTKQFASSGNDGDRVYDDSDDEGDAEDRQTRARKRSSFQANVNIEMATTDSNLRESLSFYEPILKYYSFLNYSPEVLHILQHMTADGVAPTLKLCDSLLENALFVAEPSILRVLAQWYLHNFDVILEHGILCRIMQIASATGETDLAATGLKLFIKCGYQPTLSEFAACVRSCIRANDELAALEALIESQSYGVDYLNRSVSLESKLGCSLEELREVNERHSSILRSNCVSLGRDGSSQPFTDHRDKFDNSFGSGYRADYAVGMSLQEELTKILWLSIRKLDFFYFNLVDATRGKGTVPEIAVNAIISASGKVNQLDRLFAAFQEYNTVFNIPHTVHSYNALLKGISLTLKPEINKVFMVLEDMDSKGIVPNRDTFSIVLELMAELQCFDGLEMILEHIRQNELELLPRPRAVRRLFTALSFAKHPLLQEPDNVVQSMLVKSSEPFKSAPYYFIRRLQHMNKIESTDESIVHL